MPNPDVSAPGGRESAQEGVTKPGHGANATKSHHGQQGQAQQNELSPSQGAQSFKKPENRTP